MPGAMPAAVPMTRSRRRMGVRPMTALLGVNGSKGESRTRMTVMVPPSAASSASALALGRSRSACAAERPAIFRAAANDVAALATSAASEIVAPHGP